MVYDYVRDSFTAQNAQNAVPLLFFRMCLHTTHNAHTTRATVAAATMTEKVVLISPAHFVQSALGEHNERKNEK